MTRWTPIVLFAAIALAAPAWAGQAQTAPADLLFEYAEGLYRDGLHKLAIPELTRFLKTYPNDARVSRAWFYLGECHYALKDYQAALPAYAKAARDAKLAQLPVALYRMGDCRFRLGQFEQAIAPLEKFLGSKLLTPDHRRFLVHAKYALARAYFRQRRFHDALRLYREVLTDPSPDNTYKAHVLRPIGDCLMALGQPAKALDRYRELEAYLESALKKAKKDDERAKAQRKFLNDLRIRMAGLLVRQKHYAEALAKFALVTDPSGHAEEILYGRAQCLYYLTRYQEALVPALEYLKRFAEGKHVLDALYIVGEAHYHTGNHPQAESCFAKLLAQDKARKHPAREAAAFGRAYAAYQQGKPHAKATVAAADAFLAEFPNAERVPHAHYFRAEAAYWLEDYATAVQHYKTVPDENPHAEEATYRVAVCLDLLKQREAAAQAYDTYLGKFLGKGEHYREALERAGELWGRLKQYDKAAERYGAFAKRFAKDEPNKAEEFLYRKGACEFESRQYQRMYATFRQYFERYPNGRHKGNALYFMAWFHAELMRQYEVASPLYELAANIRGPYQVRSRYQLAHTHNRIAKKHLEAKRRDEAQAHFRQAATLFLELMRKHPDQLAGPKEYVWTAEVFREQGLFPQAIAAYEALIGRYPKEASASVIYWLGELSLQSEKPDCERAVTYFRRFTETFKQHPYYIWAAFGLAEALKGLEETDEAWEWYQKVEKLAAHVIHDAAKRDALVLKCQLQLGRMAYERKRWEFARRYLLRVGYLAGGEEAAEALYKAAAATWHLKDTTSALSIWQRLLRLFPDGDWAKTLRGKLADFGLRLDDDGKTLELVPDAADRTTAPTTKLEARSN